MNQVSNGNGKWNHFHTLQSNETNITNVTIATQPDLFTPIYLHVKPSSDQDYVDRQSVTMFMYALLCVFTLPYTTGYRILVVCPAALRSLNNLGEGYVRHLLTAGHEVVFVTHFAKNMSRVNLEEINVGVENSAMEFTIQSVMDNDTPVNDYKMMQEFGIWTVDVLFRNENLKRFLSDVNQNFDAVIVDLYESEIYSGLAALYDCPMIWVYSMGAHWQPLRLIDEPTNPAYTTDYLSKNVFPSSFQQRVEELWAQIRWTWYKCTNTLPKEKQLYQNFFGPLFERRGRSLPDYEELIYNASLILANDHHSFGNTPKTPQNFKFVGGQHIENPVKPLPLELQTLMDNAKHGVIYFSMGSTWTSKSFPKTIIEGLLEVFRELNQTVIWKFEEDLPNSPSNVKIVKWAPQQSILAHPNCVLFISHGGLLSSTESVHFGVPVIGIPIYHDQFINTQKAAAKRYAILVPLNYDMPDNLRIAIHTMLHDPVYKQKVEELSNIYHDRPVSPAKEAVHWIEHVIRTNGAPHLRSPALHMPFYQKFYLDLLALIVAFILVLYKTTAFVAKASNTKRVLQKRKKN